MAISDEAVDALNRKMGRTANKYSLGQLVKDAESVSSSEVALTNGKVLIGNVSNVAAQQTVSGDGTLSNAGVLALGSGVVTDSKVSASAAIAYSKLAALPSAQVLVGNGSNVATPVALSGDVTVSNAGVTSIAAGAVDLDDLAAGVAPSHVVKYAGSFTTVAGSASQSISVPGVLVGDLAFVFLKVKGASPVTILTGVAASNAITVLMSGDPSTDHVLAYQVLRAAS